MYKVFKLKLTSNTLKKYFSLKVYEKKNFKH